MAEPTIPAVAAVTATISGVTLAVFGVDYHSMLYGFVGALLAVSNAGSMGRGRVITYVVISTLMGAVIGNSVADYFENKSRAMLGLSCLVGGLIAQVVAAVIVRSAPEIAASVVTRMRRFIEEFGGKP